MPKYDTRQEIEEIKERLARIQTVLDEVVKNHLPHIQERLEELAKRPSWASSAIITILSSIVVALLTFVLHR